MNRFEATVQFGLMALKTSILINGGAVIALLAFIGHTWGSSKLFQLIQSKITCSLFLFFLGVFVSAIATGTGYWSQRAFRKDEKVKGECLIQCSMILVFLSYAFFLCGGVLAYLAFGMPLQK